MKVLIDESLPKRRLWPRLGPHEALTVSYQGWFGLKNGALLAQAETEGFEVFLTADKNIPHQQNMSGRTVGIVVLSCNLWPRIEPALARIIEAIALSTPGSVQEIEL